MTTELISSEARNNIKALSTYLKEVALLAPEDKETGFSMTDYYSEKRENECGSVACAVGHYGMMICSQPQELGVLMQNGVVISWPDLSRDHIGIDMYGEQSIVWDWLFSDKWQYIDNTIEGAAARIDYYLEHGVPDSFVNRLSKDGKRVLNRYTKEMKVLYLA